MSERRDLRVKGLGSRALMLRAPILLLLAMVVGAVRQDRREGKVAIGEAPVVGDQSE